jgi:hypothetical protein
LSLSVWVKVARDASGPIIAKWPEDVGEGGYVLSIVSGRPAVELLLDNSHASLVAKTALPSDDAWHHLAATYDGTAARLKNLAKLSSGPCPTKTTRPPGRRTRHSSRTNCARRWTNISGVGGRMAAAGHDVAFIARGTHRDAIRQEGLKIESALGDLHLKPAFAR